MPFDFTHSSTSSEFRFAQGTSPRLEKLYGKILQYKKCLHWAREPFDSLQFAQGSSNKKKFTLRETRFAGRFEECAQRDLNPRPLAGVYKGYGIFKQDARSSAFNRTLHIFWTSSLLFLYLLAIADTHKKASFPLNMVVQCFASFFIERLCDSLKYVAFCS